jgi:hypothetical protein
MSKIKMWTFFLFFLFFFFKLPSVLVTFIGKRLGFRAVLLASFEIIWNDTDAGECWTFLFLFTRWRTKKVSSFFLKKRRGILFTLSALIGFFFFCYIINSVYIEGKMRRGYTKEEMVFNDRSSFFVTFSF